jgi:photosystem II stability/assembly factor-like uncharacterized protein
MLLPFVRPIPRQTVLPLIGLLLALPVAGALAEEDKAEVIPAKRPTISKKAPPMASVSELGRYIADLKAAAKARERVKEQAKEAGEKAAAKPGRKESKKEQPVKMYGPKREANDEEEEPGVGWLEAYHFYMKQRAYPNDQVDWSAIHRAAERRDGMPAAKLKPVSSTPTANPAPGAQSGSSVMAVGVPVGSQWEFLGPKNLTVPYRVYYGVGATSGRVNAIAYTTPPASGLDKTANTLYMGAAGGGVWKTTNNGLTWTPLSDGWPSLNVSSIAVDPKNPNKVFVGTGDYHGFGGYQFGIMRSTDGGTSWTSTGQAQFGMVAVSDIVIDPENSNIITASTGNGQDFFGYVWRSTDGGSTWNKAFDAYNSWASVAVSAPDAQGKRYYYAVGFGEIWRSADRGVTWSTVPLPGSANLGLWSDLATSRFDPLAVYLLSPGDQKVFASKDAGGTWVDMTGDIPGGYNWSQGWYDYQITVSSRLDPFNRPVDVVYVGLIDLAQSPFGGPAWRSIGRTYTAGALTHNDQHSMAVNPRNPNDMMVGNDGGLYRLTFNPKQDTWLFDSTPNRSLGITQFYHAAFHPFDSKKMLGGTQDNATPISFGDLGNWKNVGGGDGGYAEIHPLAPNFQVATSQFGLAYITQNAWKGYYQWGTFGPSAFIAPMTIDSQNPNVLYLGSDRLEKFDLKSFNISVGPLLSVYGYLMHIAVAPSDSNRIYAGSDLGELFMTTDGGATWSQIEQGSTSLPNRTITCIVVDPENPNRIVVTVSGTGSGHVFRCDNTTDANVAWTDISNGLPDVPANTIALDLTDSTNTYYVGTDVGAFVTQNGGGSWTNMTQPLGLPNVQVNELRAVYGTGYLNAATYGRGMWRIKIANPIAPVSSISTIPTTVKGGNPVTVAVTTLAPAPLGGQTVALQSDNPAVVPMPASIVMVAGFSRRQFRVMTTPVTTKTVVTLTASGGGKTRTTKLTLVP